MTKPKVETQELQLVGEHPKQIEQSRTYDATPGGLLEMAFARGAPLEQIEKYMQLKREWDADEARKAFVEAMAKFKENPPEIFKTKQVAFAGTAYKHATLGDVTAAVTPALAAVGISHSWKTEQDGNKITVICTLRHKLGHSESVQMTSGADDSGKKNPIQAIASAINYMQRYTLLSATGLATHDERDDDDGAGTHQATAMMTEDHCATVQAKAEEVSPKTLGIVLRSYKVSTLSEIPDIEYESIIKRLELTQKKGEQ